MRDRREKAWKTTALRRDEDIAHARGAPVHGAVSHDRGREPPAARRDERLGRHGADACRSAAPRAPRLGVSFLISAVVVDRAPLLSERPRGNARRRAPLRARVGRRAAEPASRRSRTVSARAGRTRPRRRWSDVGSRGARPRRGRGARIPDVETMDGFHRQTKTRFPGDAAEGAPRPPVGKSSPVVASAVPGHITGVKCVLPRLPRRSRAVSSSPIPTPGTPLHRLVGLTPRALNRSAGASPPRRDARVTTRTITPSARASTSSPAATSASRARALPRPRASGSARRHPPPSAIPGNARLARRNRRRSRPDARVDSPIEIPSTIARSPPPIAAAPPRPPA